MDSNGKRDETMPPALRTTSVGRSGKLGDPTPYHRTPQSDGRPASTFVNEGEIIPHPSILSTRSAIHLVLDNFFFAMSLMSLAVFTCFFAVTWFTVLQDAQSMNDWVLSNVTGVSIFGHSLQLDLDVCELSISWKAVICGAETTSDDSSWDDVRVPAHCGPLDKALDIYTNDPSMPIFSFVPHTEPVGKRLGIWNPPGFVTQHSFDERGKWNPTKDLMIPFQQYSFNAFAFAIDPTTNRSVPIAMFGVLDILGDFLIRSQDAGGMGKFTFNSGNGSVTTEVEARLLRVEITRTAVAKAFAVWMFLTNWTLSVGSVYITALVVFRRLEANSMVAALPFSALLAIPTIRSLYIDSPPLRVSIDAVAFFVQVVIVGLCSLVLLKVLTSRQSPLSLQTGFPV